MVKSIINPPEKTSPISAGKQTPVKKHGKIHRKNQISLPFQLTPLVVTGGGNPPNFHRKVGSWNAAKRCTSGVDAGPPFGRMKLMAPMGGGRLLRWSLVLGGKTGSSDPNHAVCNQFLDYHRVAYVQFPSISILFKMCSTSFHSFTRRDRHSSHTCCSDTGKKHWQRFPWFPSFCSQDRTAALLSWSEDVPRDKFLDYGYGASGNWEPPPRMVTVVGRRWGDLIFGIGDPCIDRLIWQALTTRGWASQCALFFFQWDGFSLEDMCVWISRNFSMGETSWSLEWSSRAEGISQVLSSMELPPGFEEHIFVIGDGEMRSFGGLYKRYEDIDNPTWPMFMKIISHISFLNSHSTPTK